jgi:hypothetical protein
MSYNMYLYEKAREAYYQDLRLEMEKRRLQSKLLRRRSMIRRAAAKLGLLLLKVGAWLKQFEQPPVALEEHV